VEWPWGEPARIERLYLEHAPTALRFAYLLTGDAVLAQDLVQDAFVRLGGRLAHLRDPAAFQGYLRRTVLNLVRMHARRRRVERAYLARQPEARPADVAEPDADLTARDAMRRALLSLPPRQRAAIVLRFYEDLSERRTAEVLRCAPGTVASLVHRGLRTLRGEIGEDDRDE
jgi:RNA polymerase sigma-70 factor (sigma-E family)